jgi:tetratricopeptide (TPR) repeat protein
MSSGGDGLLVNITAQFRNRAVSLSDYDRMRSFLRDLDYTPDPADPVIWKLMGNIFFRKKNYDLALQCYENAVEINHTYVDAFNNVAMTYKILGRDDDAEKIFEYIKKIEKGNIEGNLKNTGFYLSGSEKRPGKVRYRIVENKIGIPFWLYGISGAFIVYGLVSDHLVGGVMWALLFLVIGYLITKIRIKRHRGSKLRFISIQAVVSSYIPGSDNFLSRFTRNDNE